MPVQFKKLVTSIVEPVVVRHGFRFESQIHRGVYSYAKGAEPRCFINWTYDRERLLKEKAERNNTDWRVLKRTKLDDYRDSGYEVFDETSGDKLLLHSREVITVYKSSWGPEFDVILQSDMRNPGVIDLGEFGETKGRKWWPMSIEESATQSLKEVSAWLDKYAWQWFVLD